MNFFSLSKIGWFFVEPDNMLTFALIIGFFLMFTRFVKTARVLVGAVAIVWFAVAALPVAQLMLVPMEFKYPIITADKMPAQVDGIIVLGGAVSPTLSQALGQMQIVGAAERVTAMEELAVRYPESIVVYSGGSGDLGQQVYKEADAVRSRLDAVDPALAGRMVFENQSRNTYENAVLSKELVKPKAGQVWLLVTSASHMPRSKAVFDKAGWPIIPYPVDFQTDGNIEWELKFEPSENMILIKNALHEYLGILAYKISGKI